MSSNTTTMTLKAIEEKANAFLDQEFTFTDGYGDTHTLSARGLGFNFQFDNARRRLGCCKHSKKLVTMSKPLCLKNLDKVDGKLTDTMLHEIAHVFSYNIHGREGKGHGYLWKTIALAIGCRAERCYSSDEVEAVESKYTLVCPTGCEFPSHRKKKRLASCGKCSGGYYNPDFLLTQRQNY